MSKRKRVGAEVFMRTWEEVVQELTEGRASGSGIELVAARLGLQPTTVQQRATKYRTQYGIPLSRMPRSGRRFDVDAARAAFDRIKSSL